MEIDVQLRHLHIAPRKARAVAGLIRGVSVEEAERRLRYEPRRSAAPLQKLLAAAVAGAVHDFQADSSTLTIREIRVDSGPVSKKFRPRAFGRAAPIRRRTSHVRLTLTARDTGRGAAKRKKEEPIVRDLEGAERRAPEIAAKAKPGVAAESGWITRPAKPKPTGFIRRIFQRKVI